jgi:rSAM/selenodomain-associated transferase 2
MPLISVIIPVFNEALTLPRSLPPLVAAMQAYDLEIIIADGGSTDATLAIAHEFGVKTLVSPEPGKANQMNAAAAIAQGEILLFLHADTQLPPDFPVLVQAVWSEQRQHHGQLPIAGAFDLAIDGTGWALRWIELTVKWRSRWLSLPYGDQALFLPKTTFQAVGGFPAIPIMEDFVLVRHLRKMGKIAIVPRSVLTSARRWQQLGVWKTTLINQLIILGYYCGVSPHRLARWYRRWK